MGPKQRIVMANGSSRSYASCGDVLFINDHDMKRNFSTVSGNSKKSHIHLNGDAQ